MVGVSLSLSDSPDAPNFGESTAKFTYVGDTSQAYVGYYVILTTLNNPHSVGLLLGIFTGQLLPAAFAWVQKFMQSTTRTPDTLTPQRDGNDVGGSSTQVLPELAFIEILSAIRQLPDFPQRLATVNEYGQTRCPPSLSPTSPATGRMGS